MRRLVSWLRWPARAGVALVVIGIFMLAALQHTAGRGGPWIELSRFLPWYWLMLPCAAAVVTSLWLGRTWVFCSALAVLCLSMFVMGFEWEGGDAVDEGNGFHRVRLMTWNIKAETAKLRPGGVAELEREVRAHAPDIVAMQDAHGLLVARHVPARFGGPPLFGLPHVYALGQYIVASRHPIQGCAPGQINFREETHRYLRCEIMVGDRTLSLATAHFESPRMGLIAARRQGLDAMDEWRANHAGRMAQAAALAADMPALKRPLVVMGDLNATETSPVVRTLLATGLRDTHSAAGQGYDYTYGHSLRRGLSFLRIDHILVSPDIGVASSFAGSGDASDHRPVIADVLLRAGAVAPSP